MFNQEARHSLFRKSERIPNSLNIERIEYIRNPSNKQLILLVETSEVLSRDINVTVKGSSLIIEAMKDLSYNKPLYMYRMDKDGISEFENGGMQVAFGEIELKGHHHYTVTGFDVINPNLMKIILGYDANIKNNIFYN
jgi:hypothetical protein